jgi:hypothetical protein
VRLRHIRSEVADSPRPNVISPIGLTPGDIVPPARATLCIGISADPTSYDLDYKERTADPLRMSQRQSGSRAAKKRPALDVLKKWLNPGFSITF